MDIRTPHIRTPYIGTPSIKARSVGASLVTGATKDVIATPVIALTGNSVTITCATTGATIYYTLDGSTPTSSSTQYSSAFTLDSSCTIKAIATKGGKSSGIAEEEYVKPIIYLTQWKIVGNSEVHGNEIWSCGEYSAVDGKWHIRILPEGYGVVDIALDEPLRKVNDATDTIEFPSDTEGKATVTRNLKEVGMATFSWRRASSGVSGTYRFMTKVEDAYSYAATEFLKTINTGGYVNIRGNDSYHHSSEERMIGMYGVSGTSTYPSFVIYDPNYNQADDLSAFLTYLSDKRMIYRLATPTTETIQVPQIEEAESYSCVISQGAKAVEWSGFETE